MNYVFCIVHLYKNMYWRSVLYYFYTNFLLQCILYSVVMNTSYIYIYMFVLVYSIVLLLYELMCWCTVLYYLSIYLCAGVQYCTPIYMFMYWCTVLFYLYLKNCWRPTKELQARIGGTILFLSKVMKNRYKSINQ